MKLLPHFAWEFLNPYLFSVKKTIYQLKLNRYRRAMQSSSSQKKVLVLAHSAGIGNAVEATPLVQAIRMLWPKCHLTFFPPPGNLFSDWCVPDRIIKHPDAIKGEAFDHVFAAYLYEHVEEWENVCQFNYVHTPRIWLRKWFLKHEREYYLDMIRKCGFHGMTPASYVTIHKPAVLPPEAELRICIAPCGKHETKWRHKKWPYYAELIHALRKRYPGVQICVIGTKNDAVNIEFDENAIIDLRSTYSLTETAWLIKHSDFIIGNDCGPMHIADAVQTSGLVLFGPTCIIKNGPKNKISPVTALTPCHACQYTGQQNDCEDPVCIREITVDMILDRMNI